MALRGLKVLEFAGLAPGPFAGMILSDFGALVTRIDRPEDPSQATDFLARGKRSISMNLKDPKSVETLLRISEKYDVVIDPFRPDVLEKLGFGPEVVQKRNPGIIYARLTGFGQTGACSRMAGHDINYIALSGALSLMGRANENPMFPVNYLADFAGGGMLCALGILMALYDRSKTGKGQVIDSAMVDGSTYLSAFLLNFQKEGIWRDRGTNLLDGGAPFYETYKTADNKYVAVGALEPKFFAELVKGLGLPPELADTRGDPDKWPELKAKFTEIFLSKPRIHWEMVFAGKDACVTPILETNELLTNEYIRDRKLVSEQGNAFAAPRLSRTPADAANVDAPCPIVGEHSTQILQEAGFSQAEIQVLRANGTVFQAQTSKL